MKDEEKRNPGKYKVEYDRYLYGEKIQVIEEVVIGRDFEVLSFSRGYIPPIPFDDYKNIESSFSK